MAEIMKRARTGPVAGVSGIVSGVGALIGRGKLWLVVLMAVLVVNFIAVGGGTAYALEPNQTTPRGVVKLEFEQLDTYWSQQFTKWGKPYQTPKLEWYNFSKQTREIDSPCDMGSTSGLPSYDSTNWNRGNSFYCSLDNKMYLDYRWHEYLIRERGDYASGVVVAHEWGHHVQSQLGTMDDGTSVLIELQADCLAGNFTKYAEKSDLLAKGDYKEGADLLHALGDYNNDHGTPELRRQWYGNGFKSGDPGQCNPPSESPTSDNDQDPEDEQAPNDGGPLEDTFELLDELMSDLLSDRE